MRRVKAGAVIAAGLLLGQGSAFAQGTEGLPGHGPAYLLAQAIVALIVVVGIIYLVYFGLRRLSERQLGVEGKGPLEIVQAKHLGGDRWLYVVRIANRTLVVGGATGQVQAIADLGDMKVQGASPDETERQ